MLQSNCKLSANLNRLGTQSLMTGPHLVNHRPRLGLGDGGREGVEDLIQAETLLGV